MNPDRREFLALGVGALAVATLPRAVRRKDDLVRRRIPVMGTVAEVAVRHRDGAWAQRGIDAAFAELRRVEAGMSRFRNDSDVGRANLGAHRAAVPVGEDTAEVLVAALAWAGASRGRFDPCLGGAARLWRVENRERPPEPEAVGRFAGRGLYRSLEVDRTGSVPRVRLHDADAALDLGGIAKGYGVDLAARALRDQGIFHALVNVGGDLVALGVDAEGEPWKVGVRSPDDPDQLAHVLRVSDEAVATSGDYLKYFQHGGRRYHHLLDPADGAPRRTTARSLTVAAGSCMAADAAATAAFGLEAGAARGVLAAGASDARILHTI